MEQLLSASEGKVVCERQMEAATATGVGLMGMGMASWDGRYVWWIGQVHGECVEALLRLLPDHYSAYRKAST